MKKSLFVFSFLFFLGFNTEVKASWQPFDMIKSLAISKVQEQITSSFTGVFTNLKDKAAGTLSNPGKLLGSYIKVPEEEQVRETTENLNNFSAYNPGQLLSQLERRDLKQLQAAGINTFTDRIDVENAEDFQQELIRVQKKLNRNTNIDALGGQQASLDKLEKLEAQTDITKAINEEMDKIVELVDKICSYQNPEIPCFPNKPSGPQPAE